jgi:hypothetical protein
MPDGSYLDGLNFAQRARTRRLAHWAQYRGAITESERDRMPAILRRMLRLRLQSRHPENEAKVWLQHGFNYHRALSDGVTPESPGLMSSDARFCDELSPRMISII